MLVIITLMVLVLLSIFSLLLGNGFLANVMNVEIDNIAIIDGDTSTLLVEGVEVIFQIDTTSLITAGISLLITIGVVAGITGISFLGSGLNSESVRIIVLLSAYVGIWITLSLITYSLIVEIQIFGSLIYIGLTIGYAIGVVQKLSGSA